MMQGCPSQEQARCLKAAPHDEFLEFCAASISGELTDDEQKRLQDHLAFCASCRKALRQYESIVHGVIPTIAVSEEPAPRLADNAWSEEKCRPRAARPPLP